MREERAKTAEASDDLAEVFSHLITVTPMAWGHTLSDWIRSPRVARRHPQRALCFSLGWQV